MSSPGPLSPRMCAAAASMSSGLPLAPSGPPGSPRQPCDVGGCPTRVRNPRASPCARRPPAGAAAASLGCAGPCATQGASALRWSAGRGRAAGGWRRWPGDLGARPSAANTESCRRLCSASAHPQTCRSSVMSSAEHQTLCSSTGRHWVRHATCTHLVDMRCWNHLALCSCFRAACRQGNRLKQQVWAGMCSKQYLKTCDACVVACVWTCSKRFGVLGRAHSLAVAEDGAQHWGSFGLRCASAGSPPWFGSYMTCSVHRGWNRMG